MAVVVARRERRKKSFGGTRRDGPLAAEQALELWAHHAEYYGGFTTRNVLIEAVVATEDGTERLEFCKLERNPDLAIYLRSRVKPSFDLDDNIVVFRVRILLR
jgi:hypothetical protein